MKKIILIALIIFLFIGGLVLGPALVNYQGYFLIVLESTTFQFSIFGLVAIIVVFSILGWLSLILIKKLIDILAGSQDWLFSFSDRRKRKAFRSGLISLAEGDYNGSKKRLYKIIDDDFDGINLLALAEAEAQLNNKVKARELWILASENPQTKLAADLCIIRDFMLSENFKQALTYIENLPEKSKNQPNIVKLWAHALDLTGQYLVLKDKLPKWKKLLGSDFDAWQLKASKGEFAEIASKEGANKLKDKWQKLPRSVKKEPGQIAAYAKQLIEQAMDEEAQSILVTAQKSEPVAVLYSLYRDLKNLQTNGAIKQLEGWLKRDEDNVELLSVLGQLAFNSGDNLLAEKALSKAIKLDNDRRDVLLLAQIKEQQKDNIHALELYKKTVL